MKYQFWRHVKAWLKWQRVNINCNSKNTQDMLQKQAKKLHIYRSLLNLTFTDNMQAAEISVLLEKLSREKLWSFPFFEKQRSHYVNFTALVLCNLTKLTIAQLVKNLPAMQETWVRPLGSEDPLDKEMATHSSILAWRIPWTEEPGTLQSMGLQESDMT